jgi:pentose-5-phosphate-3-epimerase
MVHKIQTSSTTFVSLEVKKLKSEVELFIQKGDARLTFGYEQTKQINAIIESIDPEKFTLKEY